MPTTYGTIVNPTRALVDYLATHASNSLAKSLIAVATPNYAAQLRDLSKEFPRLATVAFACDTVPLGCQRSGFSWLISEHSFRIREHHGLQNEQSRNWAQSTAAIRITSASSPAFDLRIPAANTLFTTGQIAEIYASDASVAALPSLSALHVELSESLRQAQTITPAKPLTDWLTIGGVQDNMLKTLDDQPAARFLEACAELKTAVEPAVFAEVDTGEMFKVVAGGGGLWSPRASMLVLEPPASPQRGQKLRFWLQLPELSADLESQLSNTPSDGIIAEVAPVPQTTADERPLLEFKANHHIPVFGFGSEQGFFTGDHKHSITGQSIYFK